MSKEIAPQSEAFQGEKSAWKKVLGVEVDIQPLPAIVTPEVKKNLKEFGMELRFIPSLNLGTLEDLKKEGEESYLNNLQLRYPKWRSDESAAYEWKDHFIARNLGEWYWEEVKDGKIDFPQLTGTWMAVEMMPKPNSVDHHYAHSKISEKLGFKNRFYITWDEANEAITREKKNILDEAGLNSGDVRMLEAIEWNLLANREGWGKTNTFEFTNTNFRRYGESFYRVMLGNSTFGGASAGGGFCPCYGDRNIGFRIAIVFNPLLSL